MYNSVQNTQYLQGFPWGFQGCSDLVRALLTAVEMISGTNDSP